MRALWVSELYCEIKKIHNKRSLSEQRMAYILQEILLFFHKYSKPLSAHILLILAPVS